MKRRLSVSILYVCKSCVVLFCVCFFCFFISQIHYFLFIITADIQTIYNVYLLGTSTSCDNFRAINKKCHFEKSKKINFLNPIFFSLKKIK